ncbi:shugoshin [Maudiozyma exigua]|uniref:Shugoshin n=1 Tax=Maudiozyma exigua TaxID=34358 RepID=A0A9P6WF82_MAUEX|nr:shugoshin [Kazachstania exigua]
MRRVKGNSPSGNERTPQNNAKLYQLQFQELQDILDQESEKLIHLKNSYGQQNVAIAKENSLLKMKLNEMESKVSGLIQENVSVRSHITLTHSQYKKQLNDKLQKMENQLIERFQSILDLFQQVRVQEKLPIETHDHNNGLISNRLIDLPSSLPTSKESLGNSKESAPVITNASAQETSSSPSMNSTSSRKRRKSSRRQSMFVPSDFEFPLDNDNVENRESEQLQHPSDLLVREPGSPVISKESTKDDNEGDFTNSIIDYSIPEEKDTRPHPTTPLLQKGSLVNSKNKSTTNNTVLSSMQTTSSIPSSSSSVAKLDIFRDDDDDTTENSIQTLKENIIVKHSIKPPRIKSKKRKIVDERMPVSNYPEINPSTRRTRGKTVNYTLPSLRSKMRRPTEKLVDATTTINIKDLQVNNRRRRTRSSNMKKTVSSGHVNPLIDHNETENEPTSKVITEKSNEISQLSSPSHIKEVIDTKRKKLALTKSSSPLVEKDINRKRPTSQKKKLFKQAIVNDLNDDINDSGMNSSSRANKSVSFRLNDEDLSVFDLIPAKVNTTPKTYKNNLASNNILLGKRR